MIKIFTFATVILIVLLYVVFFAYIKIYHKFWYLQPCFHFYSFVNYFKNPHVIQEIPSKNNYCNFRNIVTTTFAKSTQYQLKACVSLINNHFIKSKSYRLNLKKNFEPYFVCHSETSFITLFYEERTLLDIETNKTFKDTKTNIIGVITSRPLLMNNSLPINYVDFLCVHTQHRKKGIAEQLIQTHDYNQRVSNKNVQVSLFKREGELMLINPLVRYNSYIRSYQQQQQQQQKQKQQDDDNISFFTEKDIYQFSNLLKETTSFECQIYPSAAAVFELIKTQNLIICLLKEDDDILAFYIFKDCCCSNQKMLSCIASYKTKNLNKTEFRNGFQNCLNKLSYSQLIIESISHNVYLIDTIHDKFFMRMAYFFYNYIHRTLKPHQSLIFL